MSAEIWRVIGASVSGVRHRREDMPCQDYWGYRTLPTGEVVVAVADGAGSAPLAAEGAHAMVENALATIGAIWERYRPASRRAWRDVVTQWHNIGCFCGPQPPLNRPVPMPLRSWS